jgi:hypothetical protein
MARCLAVGLCVVCVGAALLGLRLEALNRQSPALVSAIYPNALSLWLKNIPPAPKP